MASGQEIREGIAENLSPLGHQVSAYELSSPTPPCAYVVGPAIDYDKSFGRGSDDLTFTVVVLVPFVSDVAAQKEIDEYLEGDKSIKDLVESDKQLGGAAQDLRVTEVTRPRLYVTDSPQGATTPPALGREWTVYVIA